MMMPPAAVHESLALLRARVARAVRQDREQQTAIPALTLYRLSTPAPAARLFYEPCIALIIQGVKQVALNREVHDIGAGDFILTSIDIPTFAAVSRATIKEPYLSMTFKLDLALVREILGTGTVPLIKGAGDGEAIGCGRASIALLSVFDRLLALLDTPADIPMIGQLLHRELIYRLLSGPEGGRLRQIALIGTRANRLGNVIDWLKRNYARPLSVENLASIAGMATSTLQHNFRNLTAMSLSQYQKSLRLHAARQMMLADRVDAGTAAIRIGYESVSQFNREYKRFFGAPPVRDVKNLLRSVPEGSTVAPGFPAESGVTSEA